MASEAFEGVLISGGVWTRRGALKHIEWRDRRMCLEMPGLKCLEVYMDFRKYMDI